VIDLSELKLVSWISWTTETCFDVGFTGETRIACDVGMVLALKVINANRSDFVDKARNMVYNYE